MPVKGITWNDEYRKKFFSSDKVKDHLSKFIEQASLPKTDETKAKMSVAKTGRKYSEEHKNNMAETHKFRNALRKEIQASQPSLSKEEVWSEVRARMEHDC